MFLIKYQLKESPVHGIGVFAGQDIPAGTVVHQAYPEFDLSVDMQKFNSLPEGEKTLFKHYGYIDKATGHWRLEHDDIRFLNHSSPGNIGLDKEQQLITLRAIKQGEELLQNYAEVDAAFDVRDWEK